MEINNNQIIESLRRGIPPERGVYLYSVGHEKLIEGIKRHHLSRISNRGIIRFISGSWGAGKTHFFRLLREISFQNECLVSTVGLNADDAALNRFEKIFYSIIRNITTPTFFSSNQTNEIAPFGRVLQESLAYLGNGTRLISDQYSYPEYVQARELLMQDHSIDIDFKKIVQKYWETFLPDAPDPSQQAQSRAEILQWFSGEGTASMYRQRFSVNKMVNRDNAKLMLQSLAGFVQLSGYKGLVILFDEAEQAYSILRRSSLRDAHNNLLSLINGIDSLNGLFLVYATTPDFFTDPRHGIVVYGALAGKIGKPDECKPKALDTIWNFDEVEIGLSDYQNAGKKILGIYKNEYPEDIESLPSDQEVEKFVEDLADIHPSLGGVRFWRVLVTALIKYFDDRLEGETRSTEEIYIDVMEQARNSED